MAYLDTELVEAIQKRCPDAIIYPDIYSSLPTHEIYLAARRSGMSSIDWIRSNGFTWKETGYIEPDMRASDTDLPQHVTAAQLAKVILQNNALIGESILTNDQEALLYDAAQQIFDKMLRGLSTDSSEQSILVVETILLLRDWKGGGADDDETSSIWEYIYMQYGFNPHNDLNLADRMYTHFRKAIRMTCRSYKKLFAPEGTQRYYTTLMLHALAPRQSMESFFTILFDFYYNNLKLQYIPDDISYRAFVKNLNARWNSNIDKDDEIRLRSDSVASGLRTLFLTRRGYMAAQCERIVCKMDALLQGDDSQELAPDSSYWDRLLTDWYLKKSAAIRSNWHVRRKSLVYESVATSHENIHPLYLLDNERICLAIPRIRFEDIADTPPILSLYENDNCIYSQHLSVFGDSLCWTSEKHIIPLVDTDMSFLGAITLRAEIALDGKQCYNSEKKLHRDYLLFDKAGRERAMHQMDRGNLWIWAPEQKPVQFDEQADYYQSAFPGQLFNVNLDETTSIRIGGYELFADTQTQKNFRGYADKQKISGATIVSGGKNYEIYPEPFSYQLILPEGAEPLVYQISIDGVTVPLKSLCTSNEPGVNLNVPDTAMICHEIMVSDFSSGFVVFAFCYCVLPAFSVQFDQLLYRSDRQTAMVTIQCNSSETTLPVQTSPDTATALVTLSNSLECELNLPVVHCSLMDRDLSEWDSVLWHKSLDNGALFTVSPPPGWESFAIMDDARVPSSKPHCFELGNFIRSRSKAIGVCTLGLRLQKGNRIIQWEMAKIALSPQFMHGPLAVEDGKLLWYAADNFIGNHPSRFELSIAYPDGRTETYPVSDEDLVLDSAFSFPHGSFAYTVFLEKRSAFSRTTECIRQDHLIVGDCNAFRFADRKLRLKSAKCWNIHDKQYKVVPIRYDAGILCNIVYSGLSIAREEPQASPEYSAELYFRNAKTGQLVPFSSTESAEYEHVNPVRIWVINDHVLILYTAIDESVYIDSRYNSLMNKQVDWVMTKEEQKSCLDLPDYFEYELIKE